MQELELQTDDAIAVATPEDAAHDGSSAGSMIVFEGVTKVYEPGVVALSDVTFLIEKGEFVFIVGASGSGKSTLVRLLLKELEPTQGKIIVGGRDLGTAQALEGPDAAAQRRLRVPGLQAAAEPHGGGERRATR